MQVFIIILFDILNIRTQNRTPSATYLHNRTPSAIVKGATPFEVLYKQQPQYDHLKVFGSLCYATNLSPNKDKFTDRSLKCMFLGYPIGLKAYGVMHPDSRKVFLSRDVIFLEDVFPFQSITSSYHITIFPTDSPFSTDDSLLIVDSIPSINAEPSAISPITDSYILSPQDILPPQEVTSQLPESESFPLSN